MRFDDRLNTVLGTPVADDRDRAVRWRQLIDLLSRARGEADEALVERALTVARADRSTVPDAVRSATARSIAGRPLDPRLIALFAADRLDVAAPILAGTSLDAQTRAEVAAVASDEVRRFFFALEGTELPPGPSTAPPEQAPPSISDMVARIDRLRRERVPPEPLAPEPLPVTSSGPNLFRWETDPSGAVAWVDGAPRAALIGRALIGHSGEALLDEHSRQALARRAPFVDLPLSSGDPFEGDWRVSGAPAFSPGEGRFVGYRGIARRIDQAPVRPSARRGDTPRRVENADSLRELVHEIRTPLNAIIGFAEIIDGQFLGPAHRRYRERAAGIVEQARTLLAAVEDLDLAAQLESGRGAVSGEATDLGQMVPRIVHALNADSGANAAAVVARARGPSPRWAIDPQLAERLLRRFIRPILDCAATGEQLPVALLASSGAASVAIARPALLRDRSEAELLDPSFAGSGADDQLGLGFALRLVRGLARVAGGDLRIERERFVLQLPAAR